ncbi:NAD-dependent succinate-semialdehyde dehydrogenase [Sphaerisporangium sp. TRM90804]|uniref:NAD-dependent succinate-semialdehyde dehydrogenase n=1 Tax=Sphaerisporangium sp. TRM90804 TaxID=3031113 RepID=UPI002449F58F|nr:NAD-dependent succinate-semialdehyde dehydrogenase [Sphaerisporangium sp. TRM90804]MDH2428453.1 NAD-dependent succinate-semialdehyde dehydrogenase [Sphaerisporangium sp. TRM90804]
MPYQSVNPYSGEVVATFAEITDAELEDALSRARSAYEEWRRRSFDERAAVTRRAARILRERRDEFARLLTLEMGKRIGESVEEVLLSADIFDYYADNAEDFLKPVPIDTRKGEAVIVSSPLGVLFGVQPWNFPYYQLARFAVPNVMTGNVVMVKHASSVPRSALAFDDLYREAGAPDGVYTNLFVTKEQVGKVIDDPRVMGVALTGSEQAGSVIATRAGKTIKKTTLELGGSDPLIAMPDADLGPTVHWAVWGRLNNCGQSCVATKRFLIHEQIADKFLEEFTAAISGLVAGDPMDERTTLPPMSSQSAADKLKAQVAEAVEHGARATEVGPPVPETGAFVQPTILTDVSRDNPVYGQELFGPVAMFFSVRDEDEAIAIANDTGFGLGGAVFTADIEHGKEIAHRIESGMVFINHPTWTAPELPFGGIKRSGYGRELSWLGIQEFVNKKLIDVVPLDAAP